MYLSVALIHPEVWGGGKRDAASPRRTVAISIVTFCLAHPMRMSAETKKN